MKLLVVGNGATATDAEGGAYINRHSCQFLIDLADRGHAISWVQPRERFDFQSNLYDREVPRDKVRLLNVERGPVGRFFSLARAFVALLAADFVYIFYPGTLPRRMAQMCRALGKPYGLYLRGEKFETQGSDGKTLAGARFVVAVSSGLAERISGLNSAVTVIRPMLDMSAADAFRRPERGAGSRPLQLLFVGRIEEAKGIPELIEAMALLDERGLDYELTLVGGGPLHADLAAALGKEGRPRIRMTGPIADHGRLMREYEQGDIFILPTHHEGFPRVLYEAMMKSAAVVTTMVGGIPGLMRDGENCLAIPVRDPAAIAAAIERLASDPPLMHRLAEAGLATVLNVLADRPSHLEAVLSRIDG